MGEIIECKICGKKINSNALPLHLYNKHNKMKVKEYRARYENNEPVKEKKEPKPEIRIKNVEWLKRKSGYVAIFENMERIEPVAIGTVAVDGEEIPSLLILDINGRLIPPWFIAGFRGLYTRKEAKGLLAGLKRGRI